jgi:hypothetical protein
LSQTEIVAPGASILVTEFDALQSSVQTMQWREFPPVNAAPSATQDQTALVPTVRIQQLALLVQEGSGETAAGSVREKSTAAPFDVQIQSVQEELRRSSEVVHAVLNVKEFLSAPLWTVLLCATLPIHW